ncbi:hypothetical protein Dimus_035847 [Dionaea muscipula]
MAALTSSQAAASSLLEYFIVHPAQIQTLHLKVKGNRTCHWKYYGFIIYIYEVKATTKDKYQNEPHEEERAVDHPKMFLLAAKELLPSQISDLQSLHLPYK